MDNPRKRSFYDRFFDWIRPQNETETPDGIEWQEGDDGAHWAVDPNTTWAQILDFVNEDVFAEGRQAVSRNRAIMYSALYRCVTLVSGLTANLLTSGELYVKDRDGKKVTTGRATRVLDMLCDSVDGGVTPAHTFFEDAVADYCLDGNAVLAPVAMVDGYPSALRRFSPTDSELIYTSRGEPVYRLAGADGQAPGFRTVDAREVIHARWGRLQRHDRANKPRREGFATAPTAALGPALNIGLEGDNYVAEWFRKGSKSKTHFNLKRPEGGAPLSPEDRTKLRAWVIRQTKTGKPVITEDMESSRIDDVPQDRNAGDLRSFQVGQVAMVYGMPSPVLGIDITQWGTGIEQLAKLLYRFGIRQHLERFLAPMSLVLLPRGQYFQTRAADLVRGDSEALKDFVMAMGGNAQTPPFATREEIREHADLPRDPDGEYATVEAADEGEGETEPSSNGRPAPFPM